MYYLLPGDLEELDEQIQRTRSQIETALQEIGKSKEGNAGNISHDNFAFEDAQRQASMWSTRIRELLKIRRDSTLIELDKVTIEKVGIGNEVTIRDEETGEIMTFQIRGYMVALKDDAISYHAPLAQLIVGAVVHEKRTGEIGGRKKTFQIIEIKKISSS